MRKKNTGIKILIHVEKGVRFLFIVICLIVIAIAAIRLLEKEKDYRTAVSTYEKIEEDTIKYDTKGDFLEIDWDTLTKQNSQIVGWLHFKEPSVINYPVVRGDDNEFYLNHLFNMAYGSSGTIFLNTYNAKDFSDFNNILYGHRMNNDTMFGPLANFKEPFYTESHPFFYVYRPDGTRCTYQIFAVSIVADASSVYATDFETEKEKKEYLAEVTSNSLYPINVEVSPTDKIISLSTCTEANNEERLLVQGKEVKTEKVEDLK